jgi:hypothetical protein
LTKSGEIVGQYMMTFSTKKLNFGCEQVKIGTVQDKLWTLQVKYGTVQDNDSTKSGEIFGQYST